MSILSATSWACLKGLRLRIIKGKGIRVLEAEISKLSDGEQWTARRIDQLKTGVLLRI